MTCLPYYTGILPHLNIVFFLVNIICSIVSATGNSLTIFVICKIRSLQVPRNWLLASLSLTDLLAGSIAQPMFGIYLAFFHEKDNCVLEKAIVFMSAASCASSLLLLCIIARDRYLHIAKGLQYDQSTDKFKTTGMVIGSWIVSLAIASTFMISDPGPAQFLGFGFFSTLQLISFIYIVTKYLRIQRLITAHYKHHRETMAPDNQSAKQFANDLRRERSHNLTLLMILALFVLVWFPFMVILVIGTTYQIRQELPGQWLQQGFVWTAILTYVNGAINPLIYTARYKEMGIEIKKQFRKMLCGILPFSSVDNRNVRVGVTST